MFEGDQFPVVRLSFLIEDYLADCQLSQKSERTVELRRMQLERLRWFLEHKRFEHCGHFEFKQFFLHLTRGHTLPGGRWQTPADKKSLQPLRPTTIKTYYAHLRTFGAWLVESGYISESPLARIHIENARADQIQPFTDEQIAALLTAATRAPYPKRDVAIVLFLLDTGVRASEICGLRLRDVDLFTRQAQVLGKGNKRRTVYCHKCQNCH